MTGPVFSANHLKLRAISACGLVGFALLFQTGMADTIELFPNKDVAIHDVKDDEPLEDQILADGMGGGLFAGVTLARGAVEKLRSILAFDVSGNIPAGSTIDSVSLDLIATMKGNPDVHPFTIHRATKDWSEGPSVSEPSEGLGRGAAPQIGDSTWFHNNYDQEFWTTQGGDFVASASATAFSDGSVSTVEETITFTSADMIQEVQAWLDNPATNYGWFLLGDESAIPGLDLPTAYRFGSRSHDRLAVSPVLRIEFTPPPPERSDSWILTN